jgi:hypothetical protein
MRTASQTTGGQRYIPEEELEEIMVLAQRIYPGRTFDQLTDEEQEAVYRSYEGERDIAGSLIAQGQDMMAGSGKTVGPYGVYIENPWESLAGGAMSGVGAYMYGKANQGEAKGRGALADLQTNRDARDRDIAMREAQEEERKRREWLARIFGR